MQSLDKANGKFNNSDITVAKNYLNEDEIRALGLLVEQYLAFAEAQAQQKIPMYMKDWIKKLDDILTINSRSILQDAGVVSHKLALEMVEKEYSKYKAQQQQIEHIKNLDELAHDIKQLGINSKKKLSK